MDTRRQKKGQIIKSLYHGVFLHIEYTNIKTKWVVKIGNKV